MLSKIAIFIILYKMTCSVRRQFGLEQIVFSRGLDIYVTSVLSHSVPVTRIIRRVIVFSGLFLPRCENCDVIGCVRGRLFIFIELYSGA